MSTAPVKRSSGVRVITAKSLRASAVRIHLGEADAKKQGARKQEWQNESWDYFDDVPEVKNLTWFLGNAMSKLRIFAAVRPLDDPQGTPIPATDPESGIPAALAARANAELARLKGPLGGLSEILREANMNLEVAGECYLVGRGAREKTTKNVTGQTVVLLEAEQWDIKSTREVTVKGDGEYYVRDDPNSGNEGEKLDEDVDTIIRIYQRHPGASALADCHMRGVLSECELLVLLTNELKAESKSRQSAGFMTLPNELSFGPDVETQGEEGDEAETDPFEDALMDAIVRPIEDPSAPESVYPLVIRGPGEFLKPDYLRHFSIARDTTQLIEARIEGRVQRVARGLNAPVEATMGHQATTFANAMQIDEDTYEDHLEPRCVLLVDALTVGFMVPNLLDGMAGDPALIERLIVWFDPHDIIQKTDPVEHADDGLLNGAISYAAWRDYMGFSEDDAPDAIEQLFHAILRTTRIDANLVDAIVKEMDPTLNPPPPVPIQQAQESGGAAAPASADPRLRMLELLLAHNVPTKQLRAARTVISKRPGDRLAAIDREIRARVIAAADRSLSRVLERAGNRLKARGVQTNALLKTVHPMYAAATLGPTLVAAAGFSDEELVGDDAWVALEQQYMAWGARAQAEAVSVVNDLTGLSTAQRESLGVRQADDLSESWSWMSDQLHELAIRRLYEPDVPAAIAGEFDPTVRIPTGLVREALARAGGATGIETLGDAPYVAVANDMPMGGIGTGELLMGLLADEGVLIEAYEWDYGPAYRQSPFEPHLDLDGVTFASFDADVLEAGDWIGDYYFPGDHEGCSCDFTPVLMLPEDLD